MIAIGLRSRNIEDLLTTINGWIEETKPPESYEESKDKSNDSVMSLPENFEPKSAWEFFSYKPNKKLEWQRGKVLIIDSCQVRVYMRSR